MFWYGGANGTLLGMWNRRGDEMECLSAGGRLAHEMATYRCDDTRGCVMQFLPPDDEHMCSKHVEA